MSDLTFEEKVLNELRNIKSRLDKLENANIPFGPFLPQMPQVIPTLPFKIESKCSKCGLLMDGPMGYCCPHADCPCGMGPVWSGTTELK